jgi:hypothetical protein
MIMIIFSSDPDQSFGLDWISVNNKIKVPFDPWPHNHRELRAIKIPKNIQDMNCMTV